MSVSDSVAKECYLNIILHINSKDLKKKAVMKRRYKIYTEAPEALVTGCCVKKGKGGSQQRRLIISC
jgi:hypothetical protein